MTRFLLPCVWIAWGLSYPLMSWSLEAVDLFSGRLIIMPTSGLILLALGAWNGARVLPDRRLWGQLALTGLFNMGLVPDLPDRRHRHARPEPHADHRLHHADLVGAAGRVRPEGADYAPHRVVAGAEPRRRRHHHQPGSGGPGGTRGHPAHPAGGDLLRHRYRADQADGARGRSHDQRGLADPARHGARAGRLAGLRPRRLLPSRARTRPRRPRLADPHLERARLCLLVPDHPRAAGGGRRPDHAGGAVHRLRQQRADDGRARSPGSMPWRSR